MIVIGYPGIGKSSVYKNGYIDLESSNFNISGEEYLGKVEDWYRYYCSVAEDLSRQGYIVFVSSHKEVQKYLRNNSNEEILAIAPSLEIKDEWLNKLILRQSENNSLKNALALARASEHYKEDIEELMKFDNFIPIKSLEYNLEGLVMSHIMLNKVPNIRAYDL